MRLWRNCALWLLVLWLVTGCASGPTPAVTATRAGAAATSTQAAPTLPALTATATAAPASTAESQAPPTRTPASEATPTATRTATAAPPPRAVLISIDGLRPDALLQASAPNLRALAERGAYTWHAQTVFPPATLPAHASLLSGYAPEAHGVTWNDYMPDLGHIGVPTLFTAAHAAGLRTVMVVGKEKFEHFNTPGDVDVYVFATNGDQDVADRAVAEAGSGFDLMFVHFPNMDFFGHSEGWMSETYLNQLARTDAAVGRLLDALPPDTVVLVTADHGGHDDLHGANVPEDMTVPWIVAGPGVPAGELAGPVSVLDAAPTLARLMGLSLPADVQGRAVLAAEAAPGTATPALDLLNGAWSTGAQQAPARSEMPAAVLGGLIYVPGGFGGETVFQAYDPAADAWTSLAPLPEGRHHLMAAALGGRVYVFGGAGGANWTPTRTAWAYDPAADAWTELAPMPENRVAGAAVALDGRLYVVGGFGGSGALLEYDPAADAWRALASLLTPREHVAAAALDGEIWAIGGRWQGIGELASVEIYDPAAGAWRDGPPLLRPHAGFSAAVLEGRILAAGGEIIMTGNQTLTAFEIYDPAVGAWAFGPEVTFPVHGVPAAVVAGRYFLLGGSSRAGAVENEGRVLIYTP